ncbi:5-formyltetrahydrofolate cyclo-ligase [Nitrososphaera sp.]|uniref:5-formyltetrahydrofolate cyclo-ligase n=1 Tax=Nitrososphaera sp. TaxID=1971748 RepID=UPI00317D8889
MRAEKQRLRRRMLEKRNALPATEAARLGALAQKHVVEIPEFESARTIGIYYPLGSEVRTDEIARAARAGGKKVSLPRTEGNMIRFYEYKEGDDLVEGRFGVMEPAPAHPAGPLDLVVIPGVVFDAQGCRIGYGKGFYDRFLAERLATFSVGLAYSFQVVEALPRGRFDRKLGALATDEGIMYF